MTVEQLIRALNDLPKEADVYVPDQQTPEPDYFKPADAVVFDNDGDVVIA